MKNLLLLTFCALSTAQMSAAGMAADTLTTEKGGQRGVLLNAMDATKPREIQIGLPSEDVNVYENGLPAVYSSTVHQLQSHWRSDASLSEVGLLTPMESAIKTGNIAYSVDAKSIFGQREMRGTVKYTANHFGLHNFDMGLSGSIAKDWQFALAAYNNFDPGPFKIRFADYADRTQIYHFGLSRLLGDKGRISLKYKFVKSFVPGQTVDQAPFIYDGDGKVSEFPSFNLGTNSYMPSTGTYTYMDILDGKLKNGRWGDDADNESHEVGLYLDYDLSRRTHLNLAAKYINAPAANFANCGGSTITTATAADGLYADGESAPYTGLMDGRRTWLHFGKVQNALLTAELTHKAGAHDLRFGLNEWYYYVDYHSSSFQWTATVEDHPRILTRVGPGGADKFRGFNALSPEYTKGSENKLAAYFSDRWQVLPNFNVYFGGRLEYFGMSLDQIPYDRYEGFHIGDRHTYTRDDGTQYTATIEPHKVVKDKLNYAATLQLGYQPAPGWLIHADATVASRVPRTQDYNGAGPSPEMYKRVTIPLIRGGLTYKNKWIDVTTMVTYLSKSNNIDQQNVTKPGTTQSVTILPIYDIRTLGWTTSAELTPFKGFQMHVLFTWQKPTYQNYNIRSPFEGVKDIDASGYIVKEIPRVLIELDPSYYITPDIRVWLSARYFGKAYANLTNALYFNGRWETFAGASWDVNKHWTLGVSAVNLLNQKGARGTISGSELIAQEQADQFRGLGTSGKYLRPFTMEFSTQFRF